MRKILLSLLLLYLYSPARGQTGYTYWYWFDNEQPVTQTGVTVSSKWSLEADVSSLDEGFHTLHLQVTDDRNVSSAPMTKFFYKARQSSDGAKLSYHCYVDGETHCHGQVDAAQGVFHLDLDVTSLTDGLHSMSLMLTDEQGVTTSAKQQFFIKQPVGGNAIMQYQYWLNEDIQYTQTVTLGTVKDPLQLVTLSPVESVPIRSSLFHFEVTDGQPTVYAKNVLNIRFFDRSGLFVTDSKAYVDYEVSQAIEDIVTLKPDVRETTLTPEENSIKWYSLEAWKGDNVRFKLSSAATLQLFSASGEVLYEASGTDAAKWGGVTLTDDGIYYLALHDADASVASISLDYAHDYAAQPGDVNGDGKVSVTDVVNIVDHVLGQPPVRFIRPVGDMNADGKVTVTDAVSVIDMILNNQ